MAENLPLLRVGLLGGFTLQDARGERGLPASTHARSLLAFLFLNAPRQYPRSVLAALLSPDASEETARRTLNQSLWYIRSSLPGLLRSDPGSVGLSPEYPLVIDALEFEKQLQQDPADEFQPLSAIRRLKAAVDLYKGDLLDGVYEDWVLADRERLRELYIQALEHLSLALKSMLDYEQALKHALRLVQIDPLRENAHREVMRLHHILGHKEAALKQYEDCRRLLQDELGLEPEPETIELAQEIIRRVPSHQAAYLPETNTPDGGSPLELNTPDQLPLIGRSLDKEALLALVDPIHNRNGTFVVVEGEPGIGKTRLINEVRRDLEWHGVQVIEGKAGESETNSSRGTLIQALKASLSPLRMEQIRSLATAEQRFGLDWIFTALLSGDIHNLPEENLSSLDQRKQLNKGLALLLSLWSKVKPLAIVLEDFHWAGQDAWEMLAGLAHDLLQNQPAGIAFLISLRPSEAQSRPFIGATLDRLSAARLLSRIELRPLDPESTHNLIRCYLGTRQPVEDIETRLYLETGGNPLFILESVRLLYEQCFLVHAESGSWKIRPGAQLPEPADRPVSQTIESTLAGRLGQLAPSARQVVQALSVVGDSFDFATLQGVFPQAPASLFIDLGQLVRAHFLVEAAQNYRFSHDLLRQAAYASLDVEARIRLHGQIGKALESVHPEDVDALAYHFRQARMWAQAVDYYYKASQAALQIYNYHQAVQDSSEAIELALDAGLEPVRRFELLAQHETALGRLGERNAQAKVLRALERLIEEHALGEEYRLRWLLRQAQYFYVTSQFSQSEALARQALALAEGRQDRPAMARALEQIGSDLHCAGQDDQAILYLNRAISFYRSSGNQKAESYIRRVLTVIYADASQYELALEAIRPATELDRQLNNRKALSDDLWLTGWVLLEQGDLGQAEAACRESLEISGSCGDRYTQMFGESVLVDVLVTRGALGPAFEMFAHAIGLCRSMNEEKMQISLLSDYTIQIGRFLGDLHLAAENNRAAEALARKQKLTRELANCTGSWAQIEFQRGRRAAARRRIDRALALFKDHDRPREEILLKLLQMELELADNNPAAALLFLEQAESLARQIHIGLMELDLLASRSLVLLALGRPEEALEISAKAMQGLEEGLNSQYQVPYRHYQSLMACGRPAEAQPALAQAVRMLDTLLDTLAPAQQKISRECVPLHREILAAWASLQPRQMSILLPATRGSGDVTVQWTIWLPADQAIPDKVLRRRIQLERLLKEAAQAGASPTRRQLAEALEVSQRTLAQDLAILKRG